jgi:hypothetical protein
VFGWVKRALFGLVGDIDIAAEGHWVIESRVQQVVWSGVRSVSCLHVELVFPVGGLQMPHFFSLARPGTTPTDRFWDGPDRESSLFF